MTTVNTTLRTGKTALRATPSNVSSLTNLSAYRGAAMTDFEAMSYQGNRNRGSVIDEAEEGDYDEEQDENAMKNANPASGGAAALVP